MAVSDVGSLYGEAAGGWASGAELVYQPLAHALVAASPVALRDRWVLDAGAGTGAGTRALVAARARPVAVDLALAMVRHNRASRPPAIVADVTRLPIRAATFDAAIAPFVLNHLDRPVDALRELCRVVMPGGAVLASTFGADRSAVKDHVDDVLAQHGWRAPEAYAWMKDHTVDLLASADRMACAAGAGGLVEVQVTDAAIPVGISSPRDLVKYRFGMAHVASFLASLDPAERAVVAAEAEQAVSAAHDGSDLAPSVVVLAARVP